MQKTEAAGRRVCHKPAIRNSDRQLQICNKGDYRRTKVNFPL